jgi:hypothetical protein
LHLPELPIVMHFTIDQAETLIEVKILILPLYCHFGVVSVFFGFSFLA